MLLSADSVGLVLGRSLDALSMRQSVIADNIANVDTPGYTARTVEFEQALRGAMGDDAAMAQVVPTTSLADTPVGPNGNNVDLATETVGASQAIFQYQLMTRAMSDRYQRVSTVLGGV